MEKTFFSEYHASNERDLEQISERATVTAKEVLKDTSHYIGISRQIEIMRWKCSFTEEGC